MLLATILGSGLAGVDATVVNIALPSIGDDLGVGFDTLQWTVTAYTLTLASLILLGGALGDHYGRRRVFVIGVVWFALASLLCGLAPSAPLLIAARALQGVGAALLTPGSLAMIQATFAAQDRARAIGAWSGLGGVATAIGPFLGGWLIGIASWRWVFLINLPLAVVVVIVTQRHVPETRDPMATGRIDLLGGLLGMLGLGGITYAIIEVPDKGAGSPQVRDRGRRRRRGDGRLRARRVASAAPDAAAVPVPLAPVQRRQRGDVRGVRRVRRHLLPARRPAAGRQRLQPARGRHRDAADHRRDAAAVRTRRPARAADRSATADVAGSRWSAPSGSC